MKIKELIEKINIVDLIANFSSISKAGSSYKTLCNVHGDKTPSLLINPRKQIYRCFVCDHGGNALDYLIWAKKFNYQQAVEYIAKEVGENLSDYQFQKKSIYYNENQQKNIKVLSDALDLFKYYLDVYSQTNKQVQKFLKNRNLTYEDIKKYSIGFVPDISSENYLDLLIRKLHSPSILINTSLMNEETNKPFFNNRIIFPIFDEENNIVGLSGRKISNDDSPKYINSKESVIFKKSSIIYNYQNAKNHDDLIIVEGFMDVIAFGKIGYDNAIALMGTAITNAHIQKLKRHHEILVFLDNDQAGINSTLKTIKLFLKYNINGFVIKNEFHKDADEIVNSLNGKEKLLKILNNKIKFIDFVYEYFVVSLDKTNTDSIKETINKLQHFTKYLDELSFNKLVNDFSKLINVDSNVIFRMFNLKSNMVKFCNDKLSNIDDKENLKEGKELLNINKLLLTLFSNPSYLNFNQLNEIVWFDVMYKKIFNEIKSYHQKQKQLPELTRTYLIELQEKYSIKHTLPQTETEFIELIRRSKEDDVYTRNIQIATKKIHDSNISEKEKIIYLENLQKLNSKKIKE